MQDTGDSPLTVSITPRRITLVLGSLVIGVAAAHTLVHWAGLPGGIGGISSEVKRFFSMSMEANLPTYVSALNLLLAGGLSALIACYESRCQRKQDWHWWGLAIGFVLMSVDEAAMIHDGLVGSTLTRYWGRGDGIMYYNWYKLYIPLVLLIGLLYVPFLRRLPRRYAVRLLWAGVVFLSGSIGGEMFEAYTGSQGLRGQNVIRLFEETGEMLGVVLAIHTLLLYLAENNAQLLFEFRHHRNANEARLLRAEDEERRIA
jgi:hypothetical protein